MSTSCHMTMIEGITKKTFPSLFCVPRRKNDVNKGSWIFAPAFFFYLQKCTKVIPIFRRRGPIVTREIFRVRRSEQREKCKEECCILHQLMILFWEEFLSKNGSESDKKRLHHFFIDLPWWKVDEVLKKSAFLPRNTSRLPCWVICPSIRCFGDTKNSCSYQEEDIGLQ